MRHNAVPIAAGLAGVLALLTAGIVCEARTGCQREYVIYKVGSTLYRVPSDLNPSMDDEHDLSGAYCEPNLREPVPVHRVLRISSPMLEAKSASFWPHHVPGIAIEISGIPPVRAAITNFSASGTNDFVQVVENGEPLFVSRKAVFQGAHIFLSPLPVRTGPPLFSFNAYTNGVRLYFLLGNGQRSPDSYMPLLGQLDAALNHLSVGARK
jgi:hypothetical protein